MAEGPEPDQTVDVTVEEDGQPVAHAWHVAEEVPIALVYNGQTEAIMMATPQDLEDFAMGFSVTERIVRDVSEITEITFHHRPVGTNVAITISDERFERLQLRRRRRALVGRAGCGICGIDNAEEFYESLPVVSEKNRVLSSEIVGEAVEGFQKKQALNELSHSVHGAAWANASGEVVVVREDVGRHNAMDKLLGALLTSGTPIGDGFVVVSSRCSYEIVQKAARAGVTVIVALSAPTAFALRKAQEAGLAVFNYSADGLVSFQ